ncbi:hypothetical protein PFICI_15097 [Pestalotiopsis fici W106-1]|uniref:Uncharacterized protein n=1 Tax=Pestalotiopsis fici (strain W106-1 / CGMCC3.15140) TaxID=1229662 RepID=W3WJ19_PESFW|nr:uncharacterized protein PFICI_15097 [Pestalotiopsis fici W106-1]ETS73152.1 hypothetical protein PFICI_15097 [Pestalotiopsis fici W106-1]
MLSSIAIHLLMGLGLVMAEPIKVIQQRQFGEGVVEAGSIQVRDAEVEARALKNIQALATFDTLIANTNPTSSIGSYGALTWQGIAVAKVGRAPVIGIIPISANNVAVYGTISQTISNIATVSAVYPGSKVASFSLQSFYYACTASFGKLPTECRVGVAGYDKKNILIAYKAFNFPSSTGFATARMSTATLSSAFKGLAYVKFSTTYLNNIPGVTVLDNMQYTITTA